MKWLDAKSQDNDMCLYWRMILDLEIGICIFLRSIRESFAMDHYNYSRWISVHLFDLVHLHLNSPDVYDAFMSGKFSFDKNTRRFSSIAPDQLHEQNNAVIKGMSGVTDVLNREDQARVERWGLCNSELASLVSEYHSTCERDSSKASKHHEDTAAFQKNFSTNVLSLLKIFTINPFSENNLIKIDNINTYFDDRVAVDLQKLLQEGEKQAKTFWNERLVKRLIPIDAPIKKNNFFIPGRYDDQKVDKEQKLVYSNTALTKLRVATEVRPEIASKVP